MTDPVNNLAASIVNDRRYSELKTAIYEELVNADHPTVVKVFSALQAWAFDAKENQFYDSGKVTAPKKEEIVGDPDLDESLTEEELNSRK